MVSVHDRNTICTAVASVPCVMAALCGMMTTRRLFRAVDVCRCPFGITHIRRHSSRSRINASFMNQSDTRESKRPLRWGIIGTGSVAKKFTQDVILHASAFGEIASVLTRNVAQSNSFLEQFGLSKNRAFSDMDTFAASGIDVCYVATPHTMHVDMTIQCLERNLHVLVEKPFSLTPEGLTRVFDVRLELGFSSRFEVWWMAV